MATEYGSPSPARAALGVVVGLAVLVLVIVGLNWLTAFKAIDQGHIGVIQEGGPFDGRSVAGIKQPGTGLENIGIFNDLRKLPATQRFYTISADPGEGDKGAVDVFHTPTSDSVIVGVEGQALFQLNQDRAALTRFYKQYGTRTYAEGLHPYDGDDGWSAFLNAQFRPVLHNALREEIGKYRCPQLNAACALVKSGASGDTSQNIAQIQNAIASTLERDLATALGGRYFTNVRFQLQQIELPESVATAVNEANAAKAQVNTQRFKADAARQQAIAARRLADAYRANPYAGLVEALKAIPEGSQPIINIGGGQLGLNLGRR